MVLRLSPTETVTVLTADRERVRVRAEWMPGHRRPPAHWHPDHDERFEVVAGVLAVRVNTQTTLYSTGDFVEIPRGATHAMWPVEQSTAAIWESMPATRVIDLFTALDRAWQRRHRGGLLLQQALAVGRYPDVIQLAIPPRVIVNRALQTIARFTST